MQFLNNNEIIIIIIILKVCLSVTSGYISHTTVNAL